ncbi:uncharacterized protein LOC114413672 isoform X1 [Glycine soja]|uniref:uncharacterized protein isoform X1 n=1 Tax=Glycine max TaxID=3847 RepID=UPI0007193BDE|nr:uncharacterized protein LOC100795164 isoform X1 [Glycine max]XP_028233982.1 uncharacterized protein LOC114413672 isoform X1 [Glycine soja]|eukprot:XP_014631389.1 uncharacterized protein LOC100795164 isoform X1 [Glycine max]
MGLEKNFECLVWHGTESEKFFQSHHPLCLAGDSHQERQFTGRLYDMVNATKGVFISCFTASNFICNCWNLYINYKECFSFLSRLENFLSLGLLTVNYVKNNHNHLFLFFHLQPVTIGIKF